jgi:signal transduction histidine kinase
MPEEDAKKIIEIDRLVFATGHHEGEESFTLPSGKRVIHYVAKNRLLDNDGNVVGLVGTSVDITDRKEKERLALENERLKSETVTQQAIAQEQEKFRKIADQVAHDIRSPLASMLIIVGNCQAIPERERVALRTAANRMNDIANYLLVEHVKKQTASDQAPVDEEREATLVSPLILQTLTEKKYQYQNLSVKFEHHFTQTGNFCWIKVAPTAFQRMLSNIVNNAVDAFDQKEGKVILHLDVDEEQVRVVVEDNGKGMRPELVKKIMDQIAVTEGKKDGHGIGLTQVRETLQNNEGQLKIESEVGVGTKMILTFPRIPPQNWIADSMQLNDDDTVVILDDDSSIHMAWDTRFDKLGQEWPNLTVKHFEIGQETVDFINNLAPDEKKKVLLLTDFELLKQKLDGINVIKQTAIDRSILVTSHYANKTIRHNSVKVGTQILPKQLAYDIPIHITHASVNKQEPKASEGLKKVDAIFVDDDQDLLFSFTYAFGQVKKIDTYHDPQRFLSVISQYPKNTKIMLDYNFDNFDKNGIQIAEQLHALGFTQLYLLSGMVSFDQPLPPYLTRIAKDGIDKLEAHLGIQ